MDTRDLAWRDAEIVPERRIVGLARAKLRLLHNREMREIVQRPKRRWRHAGLFPLATIESAVIPRVSHLLRELVKYELITDVVTGTLDVRQPVVLRVGWNKSRIVARRPHRELHSARTRELDEIGTTGVGGVHWRPRRISAADGPMPRRQ